MTVSARHKHCIAVLLQLYPIILVPILTEWINDEDLCYVDTAACNHGLRNSFLSVLNKCNVINIDVHRFDCDVDDWLELRNIGQKRFNAKSYRSVPSSTVQRIVRTGHINYLLLRGNEFDSDALSIKELIVDEFHLQFPSMNNIKKFGDIVTHITLRNESKEKQQQIASSCPRLRSVKGYFTFVLPLVDLCHLDSIFNCHLLSLVKRQQLSSTYYCDLQRTSTPDETAVCLGEGKYYHMTSLNCGQMQSEDAPLLIPLLPNLTELTLAGQYCLIEPASQVCKKLVTLIEHCVVRHRSALTALVHNSVNLLKLVLCGTYLCNVDDVIQAAAARCSSLQFCGVYRPYISAESVKELFLRCKYLTHFLLDGNWPTEHLVLVASNVQRLVISRMEGFTKSGRGLTTLETGVYLSQEALVKILKRNPRIEHVDLLLQKDLSAILMRYIAQTCHSLQSVRLQKSDYDITNEDVDAVLDPLSDCPNLKSVVLHEGSGRKVQDLTSRLKSNSVMEHVN